MSTKQEYHGLRQFRPQYELLKNIDKQTCMMQNNVYRSFKDLLKKKDKLNLLTMAEIVYVYQKIEQSWTRQ